MAYRLAACPLAFCMVLCAQHGTEPKPKAADYPAHTQVGDAGLGAEYLIHSFSYGRSMYIAPGYLVVEVALYPAKRQPLEAASGQFRLRLNGKKVLSTDAPGMVAASLKYPDWEQHPRVEMGGGIGGVDATLGGTRTVPRFPGDGRAGQGTPPPNVPADVPSGVETEPQMTAPEAVVEAALVEGRATGPVSGHIYFAYRGKVKSIKSLELLYQHGEEQTVLPLF